MENEEVKCDNCEACAGGCTMHESAESTGGAEGAETPDMEAAA